MLVATVTCGLVVWLSSGPAFPGSLYLAKTTVDGFPLVTSDYSYVPLFEQPGGPQSEWAVETLGYGSTGGKYALIVTVRRKPSGPSALTTLRESLPWGAPEATYRADGRLRNVTGTLWVVLRKD